MWKCINHLFIEGIYLMSTYLLLVVVVIFLHLNQGTLREHSGNIQGTFGEHSGIIQGTTHLLLVVVVCLHFNFLQEFPQQFLVLLLEIH
jgi:hypothetical protein